MGPRSLVKTGSYVSMDYMYGVLSGSGGEDPLDYPPCARTRWSYASWRRTP